MFRDILSSKLVLAGLIFCVLIVACSLFYRWHVERGIREDEARTERFLQQLENNKRASAPQPLEPTDTGAEEQAAAPVETDDAPETVSDATERLPNSKAARVDTALEPEETVSEEDTADVPVSPYGFGPYPPLPDDPYWVPETWPAKSANHELMKRVSIKLISQGIHVKGATMQNGLVYPIIKGIRYVEWKEYIGGRGVVRYIGRDTGHPDDSDSMRAFKEATKGRNPTESDFPAGIEFVSYEEGGIDPYTFLDLP